MTNYGDLTPVNIITGFLGSGKTTLLQRLLRSPELSDVAVLVNEFGEVGLDHHLLQGVAESTLLLENGCLCCAVRGDLQKALRDLAVRAERAATSRNFRRVVIETSGLADPAPIAYTLLSEAVLRHHFRLSGIITTIDAVNGATQLARLSRGGQTGIDGRPAGRDQGRPCRRTVARGAARAIAGAQCLRANSASRRKFAATSIGSDRRHLRRGRQISRGEPVDRGGDRRAAEFARTHAPTLQSFAVIFDRPLDWTAFGVWASMLLHRHGADVLRLKGMLNVAGVPTPVLDQWRSAHRPSAEPSGTMARRRPAFASDLHRARVATRAHRALARRLQRPGQQAGGIAGLSDGRSIRITAKTGQRACGGALRGRQPVRKARTT